MIEVLVILAILAIAWFGSALLLKDEDKRVARKDIADSESATSSSYPFTK